MKCRVAASEMKRKLLISLGYFQFQVWTTLTCHRIPSQWIHQQVCLQMTALGPFVLCWASNLLDRAVSFLGLLACHRTIYPPARTDTSVGTRWTWNKMAAVTVPQLYHQPMPHGNMVYVTDRSDQTGGVRYRYTGPVWSETGPNRSKSNLNLKSSVQTVRTGIPVGLTGNRQNSIFFFFGLNSNAAKYTKWMFV